MKVAVLGCGPTGMIAAHAAATLGHDVAIISRRLYSATFGAMYLHIPIPGISPDKPEMEIKVVKLGTREGYAENVYNDRNAEVSWDKFNDGPTPGWDLALAYEKLWRKYESRIIDVNITGSKIAQVVDEYDIVFSTIPQNSICEDWSHKFESVEICVLHGPNKQAGEANVMYYNGLTPNGLGSWYRYSLIRGYQSWEYSALHTPAYILHRYPRDGITFTHGIKPLSTNCMCHPEIWRLGRFGKWNKHTFTHHGYEEVSNALLSMQ